MRPGLAVAHAHPPGQDCPTSAEERLRLWLDGYQVRGSFDDPTWSSFIVGGTVTMETAILRDGRTLEYHPEAIGEGTMKEVFFTRDLASAICFYKDPKAQSIPFA